MIFAIALPSTDSALQKQNFAASILKASGIKCVTGEGDDLEGTWRVTGYENNKILVPKGSMFANRVQLSTPTVSGNRGLEECEKVMELLRQQGAVCRYSYLYIDMPDAFSDGNMATRLLPGRARRIVEFNMSWQSGSTILLSSIPEIEAHLEPEYRQNNPRMSDVTKLGSFNKAEMLRLYQEQQTRYLDGTSAKPTERIYKISRPGIGF